MIAGDGTKKGSKTMKFENYAGNLGNELIKAIYSRAYQLEANVIIVHRAKYNKYAVVDLFEEPYGCICENYTICI